MSGAADTGDLGRRWPRWRPGLLRHARVAACFIRLALQTQLDYPVFLVSWLIVLPVQYFGGLWLLQILTVRFDSLAGWNFPVICFLFGLAGLSQGLVVTFFIGTWEMDRLVIRAELDQMLVRPLGVLFQVMFRHVNLIGLLDLVPALLIFAYGSRLVGFTWRPLTVLELVAVLVGATAIRAAVYVLVGSLAFWTSRTRSLVLFSANLLDRTTHFPLSLYAYWVQLALTFAVPIGFVSFYPTAGLLERGDLVALPFAAAAWTPVAGVLFFSLASAVFARGVARYTSAGS